jgi:hypothetical protein
VRGWLIVGARPTEDLLERDRIGTYDRMPAASSFKPGQWLEFRVAARESVALVCVCVELPVAPK